MAKTVTEAISEAEYLIKFIKSENKNQKSQIDELLTYISNIEEYYNGDFVKDLINKILYEIINSNTAIVSGASPEYYKGAKARQNEIVKIIANIIGESETK